MKIDLMTALCLLMFGILYGVLVQLVFKQWPSSQKFTFMTVIVGVAATVIMLAPTIGQEVMIVLSIGFALTGIPVSVIAIACCVREDEKARRKREVNDEGR